MTLIEPTKKDFINPVKKKKYPASLRFWHWANMLVITGSLITVLINATLNDKANITQVIQEQFSGKGLTLTPAQGSSLSHALQDEVWAIHTYFGYLLAGLFLFRLVMEFFQLADQKLIRKISAAYVQFHTIKQNRKLMLHELTVKAIYAIFYLLLLTMVFTGLFLAFEQFLEPFKSIRHSVKEVHGFCMYLVLAFIAAHLAGVLLAERKDGKGIVSDMINGGGNEN